MRHLVLLAIAPIALLVPGCPLAPGCGVYNGGGDQFFMRGADTLMVCNNGGYYATVGATQMEGAYNNDTLIGTVGTTGELAFQLQFNSDATLSGLGAGAWTPVTLDQTALDHADVQCSDLTSRSWWTASSEGFLPVETAFERPADGFATIDACLAAQTAGTLSASASCADELLLCPSGTGTITRNDQATPIGYAAVDGDITIEDLAISATFQTDGTLVSTGAVSWHTVAVSASGMHCN